MISTYPPQQRNSLIIDRQRMLVLLEAGLEVKAFRFCRQASMAWLSSFPGDLEVEHYYAKALIAEGRPGQAQQVLEKILKTDPLYVKASQTLLKILEGSDDKAAIKAGGVIQALGGSPFNAPRLPEWGSKLLLVRQAIQNRQYDAAMSLLTSELGAADHPELVDILHLEITAGMNDINTMLNLAKLYHIRWPDCVQVSLMLAKAWMESGNEDEAVKLIHVCAAKDAIGQIPARMWGTNFPYKRMYPSKFEITADFAIPAEIAGKLGLNQLAMGSTSVDAPKNTFIPETPIQTYDSYRVIPTPQESYPAHPKVTPQPVKPKDIDVARVEKELGKLADSIKQPAISHSDDRFPAYVILTTKTGLAKQYGEQTALVILNELKALSKLIEDKKQWSSILFLPDDLETCGKYGITPVSEIDPWKIKLALVDLDKNLQKTGERIGCVLIVGGEEVVPFHKLPNPTDDNDEEVPSDNPYASLDSNYYVSDWPVGRLPGEDGSDVGLLLTQIRSVLHYHSNDATAESWLSQILGRLMFWNRPWVKHFSNLGYSASVWRRSSLAVFRTIGEPNNLYLSPDATRSPFKINKLATAPIAYFNLHGVEDGSDWYGQRDPMEKVPGADYPVALTPDDLKKNQFVPSIIFSEACYGGHILGKAESESIALTLMGMGNYALIASTTVAYGSVTTPMIGADLLGYLTMKNLKSGLAIGPAFTKAKVEFVREMNRRQGYLDGEDQKTLISFVLYGDPLVAYDHQESVSKTYSRDTLRPVVKTIIDRVEVKSDTFDAAPRMVSQAKEMVREYLPGIEYAEVRINQQKVRQEKTVRPNQNVYPERVVVSFSKQISLAEHTHRQFARVTLDRQGKVVKLAVSR
jgi:tetratricopeptide (TPR) repeat protein